MQYLIEQKYHKLTKIILFITIPIISIIMHFNAFNLDLMGIHVWRQTQTQSTIINFYEEDMNIMNPRVNPRGDGDGIFRLEFPIMQWLFAGVYKVFGNHIIITRILSFIIGLLSLYGLYTLLKIIFNSLTGLLGAWAFNFAPVFYYYTICPMPDNFALCCAIWGLAFFLKWKDANQIKLLWLSGIFLSLGALAKLPFIIYFVFPATFILLQLLKRSTQIHTKSIWYLLLFALPPLAWYAWVVPTWKGNGIVQGFLANTPTATRYFELLQHNLVSLLPELLVNYAAMPFFLAGWYFLFKKKVYKNIAFMPFALLGITLLFYFLFELNMIGKAHDYYLFPLMPFIFIIIGYGIKNLFLSEIKWARITSLLLLLVLPFTCYIRMANAWNPDRPGINKDLYNYKTELRNAVPKDALCITGNDISRVINLYYIDKKGWTFHEDKLAADDINVMIQKGAKYLYSNTRHIDENKTIEPYLDSLILERGTIRVYSLVSQKEIPNN